MRVLRQLQRYKIWSNVGSIDRPLRNCLFNGDALGFLSILCFLLPNEYCSGHLHALASFAYVINNIIYYYKNLIA